MRPFVFVIFFAMAIVIYRQPELVGAPDFISTDPQRVDAQWTWCGGGRGAHCVVDGDTFRIGGTDFRIMGFDTPELDARCPAEERVAKLARARLRAWLNEGAFWMKGRWDDPTDKYGRQLRELYRHDRAGRRVYLGETMVGEGLARRYFGGQRESWCLNSGE